MTRPTTASGVSALISRWPSGDRFAQRTGDVVGAGEHRLVTAGALDDPRVGQPGGGGPVDLLRNRLTVAQEHVARRDRIDEEPFQRNGFGEPAEGRRDEPGGALPVFVGRRVPRERGRP